MIEYSITFTLLKVNRYASSTWRTKTMAKQYISVDASTKKSNQQVEMENVENKFTGQFLLPNGTARTDIRDTFISDIEVDGELAEVDENKG